MPRFLRCLFALALGLLTLVQPAAGARVQVNDPAFAQGLQWGLDRIGAPQAWNRATGRGITIAVVDSGVDLRHEDLRDKLLGSVSCIGANSNPAQCTGSAADDNGHGTHVAGIAVATTDNGVGVAGVAPDAKLLAVRVLANNCDESGCTATGTSGAVSAGIRWAVDHGADVINLSLGGGGIANQLGCSLCDAVEYAWQRGVIAVIAAGNDAANSDPVLPPGFADEPAVLVTATTRSDGRASYSNSSSASIRTARWPVAAPGGEGETAASDCATDGRPKGVVSTYWIPGQSNQYACLAGTSMATPHVSGALAVLLSAGFTPQQAIDRLLSTAKDLGPAGRDESFGYGRIDLAKATGTSGAPPRPGTTVAPTTAPSTTGTASPGGTSPGSTGGADSTTTLADTTTTDRPEDVDPAAGEVSTPETSAAAPLLRDGDDGSPPTWLVGIAVLAILCSALGTTGTAFYLSRS